jgi:hypothetical protein
MQDDMKSFFKRLLPWSILALVLGVGYFQCAKQKQEPSKESILARIGDKSVAVDEFIRRAEYTIRPPYCNSDLYLHKKIVLNSLIAEKLYSKVAGDSSDLAKNEQFQLYVQGRKEQAMRQWYYKVEALDKVRLDSSEVEKAWQGAGRTYDIAYFTVHNPRDAERIAMDLNKGKSFDQVFHSLAPGDTLPRRKIAWSAGELPAILQALYKAPLEKDAVLPPLVVKKNQFVALKVLGWTDRLALTETGAAMRRQDVKTNLIDWQAEAIYQTEVREHMRGKKLQFVEPIFVRMVETLAPQYLASRKETEKAINEQLWSKTADEIAPPTSGPSMEQIADQTFFTVDNKIYTVREFTRLLMRHPLVFRKTGIKTSEFAEQLRLAIADLIQDEVMTQAAYTKGYDSVNHVQRNADMWRDSMLAMYERSRYLQQRGKAVDFAKNYQAVLKNELDPYFLQLIASYGREISIDTDAFEKIKLTRTDMFVTQKNVPFPIVVPNFPVLTTHHLLDYGNKMQAQR